MRPLSATRLRRAVPGGLVAAVLGAGAAGLIACGETNGLISSGSSSALQERLDGVSNAVADGKCERALNAAADFQQEVADLPRSVDPRLRRRLAEGGRTLAARAGKDCRDNQETETTPTETTSIPTVTTPTATTPTVTTPTQTTPTVTTPTNTTPTVPTTPPAPDDGGTGGSGSGGSGNSGGGNGNSGGDGTGGANGGSGGAAGGGGEIR